MKTLSVPLFNGSRLEPLAPGLQSLLADERRFPPESADLRAAAMARAHSSFLDPSTPASPSFWRTRALLLAAAVLVTAFAAAGVVEWYRSGSTPSSGSGAPVHAGPTRAGSVPAEPASVPAAPLAESARSTGARPAEPAEPRAMPKRAPTHESMTLELAILRRARASVASGDFGAALDALGEHQRLFPAGNLREERDALRVKALAGLGRNDEARSAAERFRERFPDSVLAPRLEGSVPPPP